MDRVESVAGGAEVIGGQTVLAIADRTVETVAC